MKQAPGMFGSLTFRTLAIAAAAVAAMAAATGVAFAAWVEKGAGIFMALAETGLAWCF